MINSDLLVFLKGLRCSELQFKLLCFLSRHPRAQLSFNTFLHSLKVSKNNLLESITALMDKGVIITRPRNNGLVTYSLAQQYQEYMGEIAKLDLNSRRTVALLILCRYN